GVARRRLRTFVSQRIEHYDEARDFPAKNGTSALSPYLAAGILSPRQCLSAALEANSGRLDSGNKGVTTWISELIWREFYRHVLIGLPRVCMNRPFRSGTDRLPWRCDEGQFHAWCEGRTGVPIVDAGMRQLAQTGWMHNRLRMIAAMFLTKDLFIHWRWGERCFMRHLVDGDFANNNGGWQWSASTGTDAAPYFRIFNPIIQSRRFDGNGDFIRRFVPELRGVPVAAVHEPHSGSCQSPDYPKPIVDRNTVRERVTKAFRQLPRTRLD
ncbi:MAG: cryptochrome/photolyase family protein, partial [Planctomycetota bacterium]